MNRNVVATLTALLTFSISPAVSEIKQPTISNQESEVCLYKTTETWTARGCCPSSMGSEQQSCSSCMASANGTLSGCMSNCAGGTAGIPCRNSCVLTYLDSPVDCGTYSHAHWESL